ncbi:MAG: hypothetical protein HQL53_14155 [Magnetococcales bacterium]|nr:hypothetical protein [Magnetococcales bacterium]
MSFSDFHLMLVSLRGLSPEEILSRFSPLPDAPEEDDPALEDRALTEDEMADYILSLPTEERDQFIKALEIAGREPDDGPVEP